MRKRSPYDGVYSTVYSHLRLRRGWTEEAANRFLQDKPFALVVRVASLLNRSLIVLRHNYCERRDGKTYVADTSRNSSLVVMT